MTAASVDRDGDSTGPVHTATVDGVDHPFSWPAEQLLLDALLDADVPAPFSCTQGECGACQCTLTGGPSHMLINHVLSAYDIGDDQTLACQTIRDGDGPYTADFDL